MNLLLTNDCGMLNQSIHYSQISMGCQMFELLLLTDDYGMLNVLIHYTQILSLRCWVYQLIQQNFLTNKWDALGVSIRYSHEYEWLNVSVHYSQVSMRCWMY